jgi:hypothetical protein
VDRSDPDRDGLTRADEQRLVAVLGLLGDDAAPPRPFSELRDTKIAVSASHPSLPRRRVLAGVVAVVALTAAAVAVWQTRDTESPSGVADHDSTIAPSTPSSSTPASGSPSATSAPPPIAPDGIDGLWYTLDLDGLVAGQVSTMVPEVLAGSSSTVWASEDGSFAEVLVLHRFASDPGFSTLVGTRTQTITALDGELELKADPDDPNDPDGGVLRGNEVQWVRPSGEVFEFASFGIKPSLLVKDVLTFADHVEDGCPCQIAGLDLLGLDDGSGGLDQQSLMVDGSRMVLTRSATSPVNTTAFGDAGQWTSAVPWTIDGRPGLNVNQSRAVWSRDGYWFSLEGIPQDRFGEVIDALRTTSPTPPAPLPTAPLLSIGWNQLAQSPLSPRTGSSIAWTGTEVVVVGGWDFTCPAAADCTFDGQVFADGAAYDESAGTWRTIASAPIRFTNAPAAAVNGGDVFVLTAADLHSGASPRVGLLRYDPDTDRWSEVGDVPADSGNALLVADEQLVVFHTSDESEPGSDYLFDPLSSQWTALPDDGMPPSYDRQMVYNANRVILFAKPIPDVGAESTTVHVASYELWSAGWTAAADSGRNGFTAWRVAGQVIVNPHFGPASTGGVYNLGRDEWADLPATPTEASWQGDMAGVFGQDEAAYGYGSGWVLDQIGQTWIEVPTIDERFNESFTTVGRNLFVFGGERWPPDNPGQLLRDAWLWVPPAA